MVYIGYYNSRICNTVFDSHVYLHGFLLVMCRSSEQSFVDAGCSLANQMRMLNYCDWMKLVTALFSNLLVILGRVRVSNVEL